MNDKNNKSLAKFLIVPDTNSVYTDAKQGKFLSNKTTEIIEALSDEYEVQMVMPELVLKEIISHHVDYIKKNIGIVKCLESHGIDIKMSDDVDIQKTVTDNIFKQYKDLKYFNIQETPLDKIDLGALIDKAVNYVPPFEKTKEKGFKDSIILETLAEILKKGVGWSVIFITKDKNLSKASKLLLVNKNNFLYASSWESVSSIITSSPAYSSDLIKSLTSKATSVFTENLWNEDLQYQISSEIEKKYGTSQFTSIIRLEPVDVTRITSHYSIDDTDLHSIIQNDNVFIWDTNLIAYVRIRCLDSTGTVVANDILLEVLVSVTWETSIDTEDQSFSKCNYKKIYAGFYHEILNALNFPFQEITK